MCIRDSAGANNLVGGVGKAVVLVANNLNVGEYAAFELTFNGLATNLNGDFTAATLIGTCLLYTSPSPRDRTRSRMPSSA